MAARVLVLRSPRRFRSPYRRRNNGALAGLAIGAALAAAGGAHAATSVHAHGHAQPASVTAAVTGPGEAAFMGAVLADLGAPDGAANVASLTAWASHEGPWGSVGQYNPLDTILPEPGSWAFNTFAGGLHVQSYPSAAVGAQATAATISGYPQITASLRSGAGLCGTAFTGEFLTWSGGGYGEVC